MASRVSDRGVASTLLLALVGGLFGVHRLFTGHRSSGLLQLALSGGGLLGIAVVYLFNQSLFDMERVHLVEVSYYLAILGVMMALAIPVVLVLCWLVLDVLQLLMLKFKDADGHQVRRLFAHSTF
jgi:TM2 domain-containing membrane protein YozV